MAVVTSASALLRQTSVVILDIGAARGLLPHWHCLASLADVYQVEPDPQAIALIEATNRKLGVRRGAILPFGLSEHGGKRTLHVFVSRSSSSLLEPRLDVTLAYCDASQVIPIEKVEVETQRLENVLDEHSVARVDMVKLDTQGTELEILRGIGPAREKRLTSVEVEIGTAGQYAGQATLGMWLEFADLHGLELFEIVPKSYAPVMSGSPGHYERVFGTYRNSPTIGRRLLEVDALFFLKPELALARDLAAVRRLTLAYCVYGFFGHAVRLIENAARLSVIDAEALNAAREATVAWQRAVYRPRALLDVAERLVQKVGERFALRR